MTSRGRRQKYRVTLVPNNCLQAANLPLDGTIHECCLFCHFYRVFDNNKSFFFFFITKLLVCCPCSYKASLLLQSFPYMTVTQYRHYISPFFKAMKRAKYQSKTSHKNSTYCFLKLLVQILFKSYSPSNVQLQNIEE